MPRASQTKTPRDDDPRLFDEGDANPTLDGLGKPETDTEDDGLGLGFYALEDTEDHIRALYYGREGTGKTTAAAHMANRGRVLLINAEGGAKKIALKNQGVNTSNLVLWPAPGTPITYDALEQLHIRLLEDLAEDPTSWYGVILDSATEVTNALRENATSERQRRARSAGKEIDPTFIDRADYGVMTDQIKRLVRRFCDLPCHLAITALERNDDDTGKIGPEISPAAAAAIAGYVDLVLYCRADQVPTAEGGENAGAEFRALTRASSLIRAKDRFGMTPRALVNPDFNRLSDYITGELPGSDGDPLQQQYDQRVEQQKAEQQKADEQKAARRIKAK